MRKTVLLLALVIGGATTAFMVRPPRQLPLTYFLGSEPPACSEISHVEKTDHEIWIKNCAGTVHALWAAGRGATFDTAPVALVLSQTGEYGGAEMMGLAGDPKLALAKPYLDLGFVVIAPDLFVNGSNFDRSHPFDTAAFYKQFPDWSATGRMLRDHKSILDALPELGFKPQCIAAIGHSLGGYNALFLAATDGRVKVAVSSAGFEMMATDPDATDWARTSWFVYMPQLRPFVEQPAPRKMPWDFTDLLRSIHPRAVYLVQGSRDPGWQNPSSVRDAYEAVLPSFGNDKDKLRLEYFDGVHEFPIAIQTSAAQFVQSQCLGAKPDMG